MSGFSIGFADDGRLLVEHHGHPPFVGQVMSEAAAEIGELVAGVALGDGLVLTRIVWKDPAAFATVRNIRAVFEDGRLADAVQSILVASRAGYSAEDEDTPLSSYGWPGVTE